MQFDTIYDAEAVNGMRKQLGMTIPQLGSLCGITPRVMSLLCCGRLRPSERQVQLIATGFGITPDYFHYKVLRVHPGWHEIPDWMAQMASRPPTSASGFRVA